MNTIQPFKLSFLLLSLLLISCGGKEQKRNSIYKNRSKTVEVDKTPASQKIDLSSKGVGPITSVTLGAAIDQQMATQGADIFNKMCTACHKPSKKFIGPPPKGILKRRTPEWIMNMILNPENMVQKDPLAKALLIEFNGSPMANQSLNEAEARAILEYFRTLN